MDIHGAGPVVYYCYKLKRDWRYIDDFAVCCELDHLIHACLLLYARPSIHYKALRNNLVRRPASHPHFYVDKAME